MANVFWTRSTPLVPGSDYSRAFVPIRLQGAAADGSQDTFAQVLLPSAGQDGESAYQIWLDQGHTGSETDFLSSLAGAVTSTVIVSALGFTPYDAANPSGYVTLSGVRSALTGTGGIAYDPSSGTSKLANMAAGTIKGNAGTSSAAPSDLTVTQVANMVQPYLITNGMGLSMTAAPSQAAVASILGWVSGSQLLTVFLNRLASLVPNGVDLIYTAIPGSEGDGLTITLRHAVFVSPNDTTLKSHVQGTLGITDTQWAGLFA